MAAKSFKFGNEARERIRDGFSRLGHRDLGSEGPAT